MKQIKASLIFIVCSAFISNALHSYAEDLSDNCQKFQTSDPLKRFLLELWDKDDGIDQSCARDLKIKQSFNQLDIQHVNEELLDMEFRKQANKSDGIYEGESKTIFTNQSKLQIKKPTRDTVVQEDIAIDTVTGFQTIK